MKNIRLYSLLFVILLLTGWGCDKIDAPYLRNTTPDDTTTTVVKRKVLIEDFTGHKCPNCPEAAVIAHDMAEAHPNQIVIIAVHSSGGFSAPDPPGGEYTYDFRTAVGDELNAFFHINDFGYPNGLISRVKSPEGKYAIGKNFWEATADTLLDDEPLASLKMTTTWNEANRTSSIGVETKFLTETSQEYFLAVYLTEDSIIQPQKNNNPAVGPTPKIEDYIHMHVLRAAYNGTWGTQISSGNIPAGTVKNNTFQLILDPDFVAKNTHAVAILYRTDTMEVMQVEEIAVK